MFFPEEVPEEVPDLEPPRIDLDEPSLLGSDVVLSLADAHRSSLAAGYGSFGPGQNNGGDIYLYGVDGDRGVGPPCARRLPNLRVGHVRPHAKAITLTSTYEAGVAIHYDVVATLGVVFPGDSISTVWYWVDVQRNGLACKTVEQMCAANDISGLASARMVPHCLSGLLMSCGRIQFSQTVLDRVRELKTTTRFLRWDYDHAVRQLFKMEC